ncbi:NADH-quinone oxidoreductase subunit L [Thiomonas sp. FB-Cd]|uniref:NADH-quinone oxidoreductase subunit L n=1 Tax=Thiomonas sp. FB-Cd TaxID=1158292 RepID=UPI000571BF1E|nr:NADH-quinone oxidoreductase subunit L [Thiomonas sp. FB-Cd]
MDRSVLLHLATALAPATLMATVTLSSRLRWLHEASLWRRFNVLSGAALLCALTSLALQWVQPAPPWGATALPQLPWLALSRLSALLAVLVQLLGTVIGVFSSRYLQGEPGRARYVAALGGVLAAVHLLLLANHWLVLTAAWAAVGVALQHLLCFYSDRAFALLAAHKKRIADRLADIFLLGAATLAWWNVGSGSFTDLRQHLAHGDASIWLQMSAVCMVVAVMLRTALMPVHGWLIQVMEAPTPVSALLHAGVVNLGGFVLIRFAPLIGASPAARWLLVAFGLGTALLAGLVMLTRISIKVRLAWSTVAQMGFMVLECGLGLYSLAALHLIGHSLYKAHAFLSASSVVQRTKLQMMRGAATPSVFSLVAAPALTILIIGLIQFLVTEAAWPWWWSGVLAFAWAPLLWLPDPRGDNAQSALWRGLAGLCMVSGLTTVLLLTHAAPLGVTDRPQGQAGLVALFAMAVMYVCLILLQLRPQTLAGWRRWSYAGFYLDEIYTRLALRLWATRWALPPAHPHGHPMSDTTAALVSP